MKKKFIKLLIAALIICDIGMGIKLYIQNRNISLPAPIQHEQIVEKHMDSIELKKILSVNKIETLNLKVNTSYKIKLSDKAIFNCFQEIANKFTTRESTICTNYTLHYTYNMENILIKKDLNNNFSIYLNEKDVQVYTEQTGTSIIVNKKTFDGMEVNNEEISSAINKINSEIKAHYNTKEYKKKCLIQAKQNINKLINELTINEKINIYIN